MDVQHVHHASYSKTDLPRALKHELPSYTCIWLHTILHLFLHHLYHHHLRHHHHHL
ncbi:hypothetical protein MtrunA17_Chr1g0207401 [Medicago truncatula]|uniref:Uncharacterized protein n=1 Tax=Medicago truncatula TaxID=3880 RepID=A0A396JZY4_MEDTR|nr:hypothetical protein MtrunA17_Chr1g0207401 [Medicago truncatula]